MKKIDIKKLLFWVLITLGAGALSGFISMRATDRYDQAVKPPLSPPDILFPIVWTVLFILMGISVCLVRTADAPEGARNRATIVYIAQLAVNFFWPLIFFNAGAYFAAIVWIILLDALVILMIAAFHSIRRSAALLNLPYLAWLLFATYLNVGVWYLNR